MHTRRVAVLIPCLNEESTVAKVVKDFKQQLPSADIYVFDNDSTDDTALVSEQAGAIVVEEKRRGKGHVVQCMFRRADADIYVLVDGDDTYPADRVGQLLEPILDNTADVVVGTRLTSGSDSELAGLNRLGNRLFVFVLNRIFGTKLTDILSGYRVMNRDFVKGVPVLSTGFEIETELTIQALEKGYRIAEIPVRLRARTAASKSKIRIFRDGFRILATIFLLFRDYKPMTFFGSIGIALLICGLIPGVVVIYEYVHTGLVLRMPSALFAVGLVLCAAVSLTVGTILNTIHRRFLEIEYRLHMLSQGQGERRHSSVIIGENRHHVPDTHDNRRLGDHE
jgi:glycosyltransferase involved in cell wall biosynthesis